ncbi:glycoside hydrolase family 88 protein [Pedobacter sandarakinus]|uniref:glycoside hydrolase family 88 protein n=1 Tax=Pedobacter sandarakinus TaxID=353156 RepID=UPI002247747A|nr:glycoside hydrolase family 88 protein [Pedobacter sandarakinus]MCX2573493.1 glycoside hydrolase family 88 protein [Pedobacter sandarakinus]
MKRPFFYTLMVALLLPSFLIPAFGQMKLSEQLTRAAMDNLLQDSTVTKGATRSNQDYNIDLLLAGTAAVWRNTGEGRYFRNIQSIIDTYLEDKSKGSIQQHSDFHAEIQYGRALLLLYKVTGQQKYLLAATNFYNQLQKQSRTSDGLFVGKSNSADKAWVDGLGNNVPFYTAYAQLMNKDAAFDDVAKQFIQIERDARDTKTGLLYYRNTVSKELSSTGTTGDSQKFLAGSMGTYLTALVDVLDYFPKNHPQQKELVAILNRAATATVKYQDVKSGGWYNALSFPQKKGNYLDHAAAGMLVYGLAKGVNDGWLPQKFMLAATKGYAGLKEYVVQHSLADRAPNRPASSLGVKSENSNNSARDENQKKNSNHPQAAGTIICAAAEMEIAALPKPGKGLTVTVDNFFNNEFTNGPTGEKIPFHYLWNEDDNNGFSLFGKIFNDAGVITSTLKSAPTVANLSASDIYIIVDPDTEKETAKPNFMNAEHAKQISDWVKAGGVLVLLLNDVGNCEINKFNVLPEMFGIHFNEDSRNKVQGTNFEQGALKIPPGNLIFKTARKVYIKEISTIVAQKPAVSALSDGGDTIIATAKYGKGTVFAVGDPWFYNEYIDGRRLPADIENFKATNDLVNWLIHQVPTNKQR